ncbi:hypothetical protein CPC197_1826 [Chlamydia psittaci C1/97]|nr:hypothetical protein CPC197_1826 [Chlamydia psittaci C1/97]
MCSINSSPKVTSFPSRSISLRLFLSRVTSFPSRSLSLRLFLRVTASPSRSLSLRLFLWNLQSDIWKPVEG